MRECTNILTTKLTKLTNLLLIDEPMIGLFVPFYVTLDELRAAKQ